MRVKKKNQLSGVLVLLVFAVFGVSVLLVLLTGADVVKTLSERDRESYDRRTTMQYITTRVRQADEAGMVSVRRMEDRDVLVLSQDIEGIRYETYVYSCGGYLRELFVEAEFGMELEFGEMILPLRDLCFADEGTHIRAELTFEDGSTQSMILALRSERGARNEE